MYRLILWAVAAMLAASSGWASPMYPFKVLSPLALPEGNVNIRLGMSGAHHDHLFFQ